MRNKKRKSKLIDTKASKGRKIRYETHQKLVNFLAPIDTSKWTDSAKDELFSSLFCKASQWILLFWKFELATQQTNTALGIIFPDKSTKVFVKVKIDA